MSARSQILAPQAIALHAHTNAHTMKIPAQKKVAPQTSEKGQYPESTEGSKIAKEARKLGNMMSEKDVESKFALAMSLIYGGRPQQEPCAGH